MAHHGGTHHLASPLKGIQDLPRRVFAPGVTKREMRLTLVHHKPRHKSGVMTMPLSRNVEGPPARSLFFVIDSHLRMLHGHGNRRRHSQTQQLQEFLSSRLGPPLPAKSSQINISHRKPTQIRRGLRGGGGTRAHIVCEASALSAEFFERFFLDLFVACLEFSMRLGESLSAILP